MRQQQDHHGRRAENPAVGRHQLEEPAEILLRVEAALAADATSLLIMAVPVEVVLHRLLLQIVGTAVRHLDVLLRLVARLVLHGGEAEQAGALRQRPLLHLHHALARHLVHQGEADRREDGGGEDEDRLAEADLLLKDLDDGGEGELTHAGAGGGDPGGQAQVPDQRVR